MCGKVSQAVKPRSSSEGGTPATSRVRELERAVNAVSSLFPRAIGNSVVCFRHTSVSVGAYDSAAREFDVRIRNFNFEFEKKKNYV